MYNTTKAQERKTKGGQNFKTTRRKKFSGKSFDENINRKLLQMSSQVTNH